jgi:hypothetical protein
VLVLAGVSATIVARLVEVKFSRWSRKHAVAYGPWDPLFQTLAASSVGFSVIAQDQRIGVVEHLETDEWGEVRGIVVSSGLLRRDRRTLSLEDVALGSS